MELGSNPIGFVVTAVSQVVLPSNPRRRGLLLSPSSAGRITLSFGRPAVLDLGDVTLHTGQAPVFLSVRELGHTITDSLNAVASVGLAGLSGMEVIELP